jgi:peptidyl-prolyl cis-trans isomerase C
MVRFELMAREAEKKGYGRDEAVVRSLKQNAVQQLIRREFDERITVETIPAADVQAYYDGHPDEFHRPEMVRASHILLASESEANELMAKVRGADARTFRQLARQHSIDTETKLRGGDLRYFNNEGRAVNSPDEPVDAAITTAAFGLRERRGPRPGPRR